MPEARPEIILAEGQVLRNALFRGDVLVVTQDGCELIACCFEEGARLMITGGDGRPSRIIRCYFGAVRPSDDD